VLSLNAVVLLRRAIEEAEHRIVQVERLQLDLDGAGEVVAERRVDLGVRVEVVVAVCGRGAIAVRDDVRALV
jgi:hypothetical protein